MAGRFFVMFVRAAGIAVFALVVIAGLIGNQSPFKNIAPTMVWVIGWAPDPPAERLLRRFGEVVDVTGLDDRQIVERVVAAQPDGVMVFNDVPMRLAAAVADARGLRFHSVATATSLLGSKAVNQLLGCSCPLMSAVPVLA